MRRVGDEAMSCTALSCWLEDGGDASGGVLRHSSLDGPLADPPPDPFSSTRDFSEY